MATAFKLFRKKKDGNLYPLYVEANTQMPIGVWIDAVEGERRADGKVKANGCGGSLAYRPGLHLGKIPKADWIGKKQKDGTLAQRKDCVWCEVEYSTEINYQQEARENGWKKGRWAAKRACLDHLPVNGYYEYKTNSKQPEPWIICGSMRIIRELTNEEVATICRDHGVEPQKVAQ